jgi:predicted nucleic acid-binding protein
VTPVVLLDSGPLGLLCHSRRSLVTAACKQWLSSLLARGRRVLVPEIADYEVRRELLRIGRKAAIVRLDALALATEYLPITTTAMRRAAELWGQARQQGQPTAGDNTIDGDMILAAQALTLGAPAAVIATTNVGHLSRFVQADLWAEHHGLSGREARPFAERIKSDRAHGRAESNPKTFTGCAWPPLKPSAAGRRRRNPLLGNHIRLR